MAKAKYCLKCDPKLKTALSLERNYCEQCGSQLIVEIPSMCAVCKQEFEDGDKFCSKCGALREETEISLSKDVEQQWEKFSVRIAELEKNRGGRKNMTLK